MNPRDRRDRITFTLFWLALTACACLGTQWLAGELGADWRLATALALGAALATLLTARLCGVAGSGERGT